jgi:hypothetical protein
MARFNPVGFGADEQADLMLESVDDNGDDYGGRQEGALLAVRGRRRPPGTGLLCCILT